MIRRRAVVGLSMLCALLVCAFAAQSASAAKAVNTTAVTCVAEPEGKGDFDDGHCDSLNSKKEGKFTHQAVPLNETKTANATNQKVTNSTKDSEPIVIRSKVGLTQLEITCTTMKTNTSNSKEHNVDTSGKHTFTGNGAAEFSACTVNKPAKCTIKEPLVAAATFAGAEKLGAGENEMGVEFVGEGMEETFAEIVFEGAECSSKGKAFKVKGSAIGTSGPTTESSQTNKYSGATIVFTPKNGMQKLKVGVEPAEVTMIVTPQTPGGNPVSITTTT